ncbi:MAG: nucleotide pyrophosphohydrolase [Opitutae bacterium]|nr:nucleotide pyrophosphohydrolase [Opitutae bacterium]|tara:strand:- start:4314 stop:4655 length:342 start_codon:yes stop_codon:yes gene_type:complete
MSDFEELLDALEQFRDERDWGQFHDSKNLALALSIEAAELNELFLWKKEDEAEQVDKVRLREELADVFAYAIMLAGRHGLDVPEIVKDKIAKNAEKYPVEKAKGSSAKYEELK